MFIMQLIQYLFGLAQSEKTFLMSTPKHLGAQIWQIYLDLLADLTPGTDIWWPHLADLGVDLLGLPSRSRGICQETYPPKTDI